MSRFLRLLVVAVFFTAPVSAATFTVNVGPGLSFNPAAITVAAGDTVTWNFVSPNHTTTSNATSGADSWDSNVVAPGGTFSHTFVSAGGHPYYCAIHSSPGGTMMNGIVTVTAPPAAPVLTSISPSSGSTGGGTSTTLTGSGFVADCVASFGGVNAPITTFTSPTTLQAITAAQAPGTVSVRVSCSTGTSVLPAAFTFIGVPLPPPIPPPSIPTLSPWAMALLAAALMLTGLWMRT